MATTNVVTDADIGAGLAIVGGKLVVDLQTTTLTTERSFLAATSIPPQDVNDNGLIAVNPERLDQGWALNAFVLEYAGEPDRVRISLSAHQSIADTVDTQRPAPVIELSKNGSIVAVSATGYIRDDGDHEESSHSIAWIDPAPGVDPTYTILSRQESSEGGRVDITIGAFSAEAIELVDTLIYEPSSVPTTSNTTPTLAADAGQTVVDHFEDRFGNLRIQLRNQTNAPIQWQALLENVPYGDLSALGAGTYTLLTDDNGDGTFTHLFTGTAPLDAFQNIVITGGIAVSGTATGLSIYAA